MKNLLALFAMTLALALSIVALGRCCELGTYKAYVEDVTIAIPDEWGISTPPVELDHGSFYAVAEVAVGLEIEHTYAGDLVVILVHRSDSGLQEAVRLLNRPGGGACGEPLVWYGFEYQFAEGDPPWTCGDPVGECYGPAAGSMERFVGTPSADGDWRLDILDEAPGDVGILHGWTLYVRAEPYTAVDAETWGRVKGRYR